MCNFEEIYEQNFNGVWSFFMKLSSDKQLSEELTQETFYRAFISLGKFRGESGIYTWLIAIAKNTWFSHLRKKRQSIDNMSVESIVEFYSDKGLNSPEDSYIKSETAAAVRSWIKSMPQKYRDVVVLRIYAGLPFKQVAQAMNITENSAKVLYFRAKNILKERIEQGNEM